jgi:hypothetical protein
MVGGVWVADALCAAGCRGGSQHVVNRTGRGRRPFDSAAPAVRVIGRAPRSQPPTNLLLANVAKSLRQRHLSWHIWSAVPNG